MAIISEKKIIKNALMRVAEEMLIAAKTAPKGRGIDNMVYAAVEGDDIKKLADRMIRIHNKSGSHAFERDAANIMNAPVIVLLGTRVESRGLNETCQLCGYNNCKERETRSLSPCVFNSTDLGIAVGSAVSVAKDRCVDNRVMYTIGQAAKELRLFGEDVKIILGIPLSATSKNIFFDRK